VAGPIPAAWLYERLADRFGGGQVFKDVDSIEPGDDFVEVITRAVGSCDVLLALIGTEWLTITDEHGRRRPSRSLGTRTSRAAGWLAATFVGARNEAGDHRDSEQLNHGGATCPDEWQAFPVAVG
jgi:hypothetical protein